MAKSARQTVFEGMEFLPGALTPFVEKRLETVMTESWRSAVADRLRLQTDPMGELSWDQIGLLNAIDRFWGDAFRTVLGRAERAIVNELISVRHKLSHNGKFSYDDAERALDSMRRLMEAISAAEAANQLGRMRDTILRTKFAELRRTEERRGTRGQTISVDASGGLKPWRQVVEPHEDVATGEFQQAEFAADLGKVHAGSAPPEYIGPHDFYSRTYLTEGLSILLVGVAKRLSGTGGDPVVELQTNFGGGKTHSMLALYHMAGGTPAHDLPGLDQLLAENGVTIPKNVKRAVLVGTARGPLDTISIRGGREIRTTWGEMAWQLGGEKAFDRIAENDAKGIAPGSHVLEAIFRDCSPCLVLIDEWVAYLRQIYKTNGLPSGSFDANLTFVQSLTEAVKASPATVLVAALPASQIEVGGDGGTEALARLKQTFSRVESTWRPASQEESYEIVRRRLFKEISGDRFHHRDNTLKHFAKLYRENSNEFPRGSADEDYRRKLERAYPIHPELFDQLYTNWGSLERFQRTRGVLRLMAQAIHGLWMGSDPSVMIMPGSIAVGGDRVESELLHYLDLSWQSIIAGDVDGDVSIPYKIDQSAPNLNRFSATRRVARAIFMGTAPVHASRTRGLDDKQINLGVVQPGERPVVFGDALRRLNDRAKFLHSEHGRYWYSMSASLNRLGADRAEQIDDALVDVEIDNALKEYISRLPDRGHFDTIQVAPVDSADIPDEAGGVRAVVLGVGHPHNGRDESPALTLTKHVLLHRGSTPRVYRNMLVFLAAEVRQVDSLKEGMRSLLAWESIVHDTELLNLTQRDSAQARAKVDEAKTTVCARVKEAWCYVLCPEQDSAQADVDWISRKVPANDGVLRRASKRLVEEEVLLPVLGPESLNRQLKRYLWNEKDHLYLKDLWEYLNRYTYLPRLTDRSVLANTVAQSISSLIPGPFAYAESWDEASDIYRGLAITSAASVQVVVDSESVIIAPDVAEARLRLSEKPKPPVPDPIPEPDPPVPPGPEPEVNPPTPTRFIGAVMISPNRPARDINKIVEGVVEPLATHPDANVSIRLEIEAEVLSGLDSGKVRTLAENTKTLKFVESVIK